MNLIVQLVLNGLLAGALYAVIALGLSLVFGIMKIINFAHGSLLMLAMYAGFWSWKLFGVNPYILALIVAPALFVIGYLVEWLLIEPVFRKEYSDVQEPIGVLLLTCGLAIVLNNLALLFFSANQRTLETTVSMQILEMGDIILSLPRVYAFVGSVILTAAIYFFLSRTMVGKAMTAIAQDRDAARLIGVNVDQIYRLSFALNAAILGVAGVFLLPFFSVFPEVGELFNLKSFVVVVLGGVGSIPAVFLGGLVVGFVESFGTYLWSAMGAEVLLFVVFITFLLFRPKGILGKE
jgi:branched-chain amino acid transport system permease protein